MRRPATTHKGKNQAGSGAQTPHSSLVSFERSRSGKGPRPLLPLRLWGLLGDVVGAASLFALLYLILIFTGA